jgi:hypothetical protein
MIHLRVSRNSNSQIDELHISVTTPNSLANFTQLVNRALNCWDEAPKELKELGDLLTHGRVTQEYRDK